MQWQQSNQPLLFQDSKLKFCNAFAFISGCQPGGGLQVTLEDPQCAIHSHLKTIHQGECSTLILQIRNLRLSQEVDSGWVGAESPYTDCLLNLFSITHELHFVGNSWQKEKCSQVCQVWFWPWLPALTFPVLDCEQLFIHLWVSISFCIKEGCH